MASRAVWDAPQQPWHIESFIIEGPKRNEESSRIESKNHGTLDMAIANSFLTGRILAGIEAGVIREVASVIIYPRLPLTISVWLEVGNLMLVPGIEIGKVPHCAVHDVAGNTLDSAFEVVVVLLIRGTVIDVPVFYVGKIESLLNIGNIVRIILQHTIYKLEWVRGGAVLWHVNPTWPVIIVPLHPWHFFIVIAGVHCHGQADLLHIADTTDAVGFLFGVRQCRQQHGSQNGNDCNDHQ